MDRRSSPTHFSAWLRRELRDRHWTERELAERAGVSRAAVCRWLLGNRVPSAGSIPRLASALTIPGEAIVDELATDGIALIPLRLTSAGGSVAPQGIPSGNDDFPGWLATELDRRGLSSRDVALRAGEEAAVVDFWLRGLLAPSSNQIVALAAALSAA